MEPREAAELPLPSPGLLAAAWEAIAPQRAALDELLRAGEWEAVVDRVDSALLLDAANLPPDAVAAMRSAARRRGAGWRRRAATHCQRDRRPPPTRPRAAAHRVLPSAGRSPPRQLPAVRGK